jgi:N4-gp56 family major capsid protein
MADMYEDDISDAMKTQVAERMVLIRELEVYSKVRASTNRFYGGTGTTLATVDGKVTAKMLRKIARSLAANHTKRITSILAPTPNIGTKPIEAAFLVFCNTDIEADLRDTTAFPGYTPVAAYGSRKPMHELELGSFEQFRFIASPELVPFQNGGALIGSTGCLSSGGTNIDVYPLIVCGQEAYGTVALRGSKSFDLSVIPVGNKDSADPLGQRGYIGAKFYAVSVLLNQQWMACALVGAGNLA